MGRTVNEVIAALPARRRRRVERRFGELKPEVEELKELHKLAGKALADTAAALKVKRPPVSKD